MADLPQSFLDSMKEILGEDYEAFFTGAKCHDSGIQTESAARRESS